MNTGGDKMKLIDREAYLSKLISYYIYRSYSVKI